jgi:hypothetical protein
MHASGPENVIKSDGALLVIATDQDAQWIFPAIQFPYHLSGLLGSIQFFYSFVKHILGDQVRAQNSEV